MLDLQTTQIGSLPYDDVEDAISFSMEHDIPFLPELPALGDAMLSYAQHPGRLSCLEAFWEATTGAPLVKVQSVGPVTLIQSGYTEDDALGAVYAHLDRILSGMASRPILFLDEPGLGYVGIDYEPLWEALFGAFDTEPGVHVCGNADWDPTTHVSAYAASHPLEDFAECFAHYLHILDALDTTDAHGLAISGNTGTTIQTLGDFDTILDTWRPINAAINAVAETLGTPAVYPFDPTGIVVDKLDFIHRQVTDHVARHQFYESH
jgi:hypothetical protein